MLMLPDVKMNICENDSENNIFFFIRRLTPLFVNSPGLLYPLANIQCWDNLLSIVEILLLGPCLLLLHHIHLDTLVETKNLF